MSIGTIGHSSYAMSALNAAYGTISNSHNSTVAVPKTKKDSATISNAAKGAAKTSQEEASESASAKASEQASGDAS